MASFVLLNASSWSWVQVDNLIFEATRLVRLTWPFMTWLNRRCNSDVNLLYSGILLLIHWVESKNCCNSWAFVGDGMSNSVLILATSWLTPLSENMRPQNFASNMKIKLFEAFSFNPNLEQRSRMVWRSWNQLSIESQWPKISSIQTSNLELMR